MRIITKFILCLFFHFLNGERACYNSNGNPVPCEPSLINLVHEDKVEASSTCGSNGSEYFCTDWIDKTDTIQKTCEKCDVANPEFSKSPALAVDSHVRGKETCWMSQGIPESNYPATVNITLGLKKRSSVAFITVELCGHNPDAIVIYKLDNDLEDWFPWQYFAKDCKAAFGMEHQMPDMVRNLEYTDKFKPVCFDLEKSIDYGGDIKIFRLIPFNPKQGKIFNDITNQKEQDWLTATKVRISYILLPKQISDVSLTSVKHGSEKRLFYFGSSDINIGGQPVCHGHAYKVKETSPGSYECDCQHSTAGRDCEKCHPEFNDQPWSPATVRSPVVCKRCECNNHSKICRFDLNIYLKSGRGHGSSCINCGDNTTGPQCDQCAPGYYRNHAFPIYHRNACQKCFCHLIGSHPSKPCDPITGKCFCKIGVTGETCSRCVDGYKQTNSQNIPCKRARFRNLINPSESSCGFCLKKSKRINFKRFCQKEIIMKVSLRSKESRESWIRFIVTVERAWNRNYPYSHLKNLNIELKESASIWIKKDLVDCNCIEFEFGRSYLVMATTKTREFMGQKELILNQRDVVEEWINSWEDRFSLFNSLDRMDKCNKFVRTKRHISKKPFSYLYNQYGFYS